MLVVEMTIAIRRRINVLIAARSFHPLVKSALCGYVLARYDLQEPLDLALLLALGLNPIPDHLLLDTHVLHEALDQLPTEFREVLILRELEGLSYKQIASVVDLPVGTVMSRLSRARQRLSKEMIERQAPGGRP